MYCSWNRGWWALEREESKVKARWAGYFEWLYHADPLAVDLDVRGVTIPIADPPINCDPPLFAETQAVVNRLKWGETSGNCGIHAELLKAGNAGLTSLYAVLCFAWNTGIIPPQWKTGLVVPLWKGKGDRQDCNNYRGVKLLSVPGKVFAQIILDRDRLHSSQAVRLYTRGHQLTVSLLFGTSQEHR